MKRKIVLTVLIILSILTIILVGTYAYFVVSPNYTSNAYINTTTPSGSYNFTASNSGNIAMSYTTAAMKKASSSTTAIASDNAAFTISLKSPDSATVTICTYDLVWEWTGTNTYTTPSTTLPFTDSATSTTYNYEFSVLASSSTTGNPSNLPTTNGSLAETNLSNFVWNSSKAIILTGATIASQNPSTATTTTWTVTSKIYNIAASQDALANKSYAAKIYADNINCNMNSVLPSGYTQVSYTEANANAYIQGVYTLPSSYDSAVFEFKTHAVPESTERCFIGSTSFEIYYSSAGNYIGAWQSSAGSVGITGTDIRYTTNYVKTTFTPTKRTMYIDYQGGKTSSSTSSYPSIANYSFNLFSGGAVTSYRFKGRMYFAKFYYNNQMVREFIPAKNSSNVYGIYDLRNSGKNLFDATYLIKNSTMSGDYIKTTPATLYSLYNSSGYPFNTSFQANTQYTVSYTCYYDSDGNSTHRGGGLYVLYTDGTGTYGICPSTSATEVTITTAATKTVSKIFPTYNYNLTTYYKNIQVEKSSAKTAYEPHPFYQSWATAFTGG